MTAVAAGGPGKDVVLPEDPNPPPKKRDPHGPSDLGHIAHLLTKVVVFLRDHTQDQFYPIQQLATSDMEFPPGVSSRTTEIHTDWIVEPGIREFLDIVSRSKAEAYVQVSEASWFLMVRRRS